MCERYDLYQYPDKVSIIVPVYNVERYITRCVNSLIKQNYKNIEIILVDDGSQDKSAEIIDKLSEADIRIQVIHKKNGGVSSARNAGMDIAAGDYIMFVDGDDWVEPEYVSYFLEIVKENNCLVGMDRNNDYAGLAVSVDRKYIIDQEKAVEWIYMGKLFVAVWNKIYSAKLLKENNISFNEDIWYGEGMLFNIECLQFCDKVAVGEKSVYHQTVNPDSAMRSFNLESNFCGIRSLEIQKANWKKSNKHIEKAWKYHKYCFNRSIIDGLVRTGLCKTNKSVFDTCVQNIRKNLIIPISADISLKQKLAWIAYAIGPVIMARRSAKKFAEIINKWGIMD